jgi:predicted nucleic acid-binding protein
VDGYHIDTSILSAHLDLAHPSHQRITIAVDLLPAASPLYVSVVALAELTFGVELPIALGKGDLPALRKIVADARKYAVIDLSHHTATAYGELKSKIAAKYLGKSLRRDRPKYIEDWIDKATGKALGIDENDLWMCAQAKERGLVLVTGDGKMQRIADADSDVRLLIL